MVLMRTVEMSLFLFFMIVDKSIGPVEDLGRMMMFYLSHGSLGFENKLNVI